MARSGRGSNEDQIIKNWGGGGGGGGRGGGPWDPGGRGGAVYLDVQEVRPADASGAGRRVRLHTRGWLPYTLRWEFEVVESRYPYGFALTATGDFNGRGVWTFAQDGPEVNITYDWRISAEKPLLRNLSFLLKPVFAANHRWAMAQGETS